MNRQELSGLDLIRASFAVFVTLAGTTLGLTWLYLGMRSVMEVGGFCAEGGAFEIAVPCPKGVPLLVTGGFLGGGVMCLIYALKVAKYRVPSFLAFAWPALFLSLGWNFLEFGLDPPGEEAGLAWGWLVCAILFGLMGGLPLLVTIKPVFKRFAGAGSDEAWGSGTSQAALKDKLRARSRSSQTIGGTSTTPDSTSEVSQGDPGDYQEDLVSQLERLHALHRSGGLDDAEFHAAKDKLLDPGGPS